MNRKELAGILKIHPETLSKLLQKVGLGGYQLLTPNDLELVYKTVCHPIYFKVSRTSLAKMYKRHPETFSKWLKKIGINHNRKLSYEELKLVYAKFGISKSLKLKYPEETNEFVDIDDIYSRFNINIE
ncbi:hypothetical protein MASR2M41_26750 [Flammeovirgaceae bacterium]